MIMESEETPPWRLEVKDNEAGVSGATTSDTNTPQRTMLVHEAHDTPGRNHSKQNSEVAAKICKQKNLLGFKVNLKFCVPHYSERSCLHV